MSATCEAQIAALLRQIAHRDLIIEQLKAARDRRRDCRRNSELGIARLGTRIAGLTHQNEAMKARLESYWDEILWLRERLRVLMITPAAATPAPR